MNVYIGGLVLTVLILCAVQSINRKKYYIALGKVVRWKLPSLLMLLPMIPLTVIAAIRFNVGYDYQQTYVYIFNKVLHGLGSEAWGDYGYTMLNRLVVHFTDDYAGIFIVTAVIFCFCVFYSIYQLSSDITMSVFLMVCAGFYFNFLNGMRQMLALAIVMLSLTAVKQRRILRFLMFIGFACLFHFSALIFLPVYWLETIGWKNRHRYLAVLLTFAGSRIITIIIKKVIMMTKYSWYFTEHYASNREGYVSTVIAICVFVFVCFMSKKKEDDLFLNMQMIAVCLQAFVGLIPQINRIGWYYSFSLVYIIPNVISDISDRRKARLIKAGVYIVYFIYMIYTVGIKNSNTVLPYQTIFSR